MVNINKK